MTLSLGENMAFASREEATHDALVDVAEERRRQHAQWGTQRHDWPVWITVLSEEVGELAQEVLRRREDERLGREEQIRITILGEMRAEAVQAAAVLVAMIEHIDEELGNAP